MHQGKDQFITEGNTEVSAHVSKEDHDKGDITIKVMQRESNQPKRGIKEALAIKEVETKLNEDGGIYKLPPIYDLVNKRKQMMLPGMASKLI